MSTFTCHHCQGVFPDTSTDDEVREEFRKNFPEQQEGPTGDDAELCDRCYARFMAWFDTLTDDQKRHIRETHDAREQKRWN